jgi:hypothetical protein
MLASDLPTSLRGVLLIGHRRERDGVVVAYGLGRWVLWTQSMLKDGKACS